MLQYFLVVLLQVLKLFIMIGIGFLLGKLGRLTPAGTKEISGLLLNVVLPCLVVATLQADWDASTLILYAKLLIGMGLCHGLFIIICSFLFKKEPEDTCVCLQYGTSYGNQGYMGIPLIAAIMGNSAIMAPVLSMVILNLYSFTHGTAIYGGRKSSSIGKFFKTPVIISLIVGFALMLLRIRIPEIILSTMNVIGDINTPIAMFIIGAQLSAAKLSELFKKPSFYLSALLKLLLMPAVCFVILMILKVDRDYYLAAVILMGTPTAGLTSIFAAQYNRDVATASQLVSFSTILSIITLPLVAALANMLL